ncbi:MAG: hypothetical protein LKF79_04685 [Solobacterium sp.]|jgi:hypothetical protein|nr:hypothetical protein [Solobacterium sp.]MCH4265917.1 hypothetical protein [Solobacterium sp.]
MLNKLPPNEKAYEAFSAIADGRVAMHEDYAHITSSDHSKVYEVRWQDHVYYSTDSATYWQGYPGYPVIAVLMEQGKLPHDRQAESLLKNISWKQLNDKHKRNYQAAAEEVFQSLKDNGIDPQPTIQLAHQVNESLAGLDIEVKRGKKLHD